MHMKKKKNNCARAHLLLFCRIASCLQEVIAAKTRYFSSSPLARFIYASAAATILYSTVAPHRPINANATLTNSGAGASHQANPSPFAGSAPKPRRPTSRERIHIIDFGMELRMQWLVLPPGLAGRLKVDMDNGP